MATVIPRTIKKDSVLKPHTFNIPTQATLNLPAFADLLVLLYGQPKVGKTTFASNMPGALHIQTQAGGKFRSIKSVTVLNWITFMHVIQDLQVNKSKYTYTMIIVDVVDELYKMCLDYVCVTRGIDHPSDDKGHGKVWSMVSDTFALAVDELEQLGKGVLFIGHSTQKDITFRGIEINKTMPAMGAGAYRKLNSVCDLILYVGFDYVKEEGSKRAVEKRVIFTKPSAELDCGDRTGLLPEKLALDYTEISKYYSDACNTINACYVPVKKTKQPKS